MDQQRSADTTFACDFRALDAAQKVRQQRLFERMHAAVQETRELPGGFALRLPSDGDTVLAVTEFITLERLCCPFFAFQLELGTKNQNAPLWLSITGREGAKDFMRAELSIA